jgi:hypothetical protein
MIRRPPSLRALTAGALASGVAVFGVLALRVYDGDDPALGGHATASSTSSASTGDDPSAGASSSSAGDPYDYGTDDSPTASSSDQSSPPSQPSSGTTRAS